MLSSLADTSYTGGVSGLSAGVPGRTAVCQVSLSVTAEDLLGRAVNYSAGVADLGDTSTGSGPGSIAGAKSSS